MGIPVIALGIPTVVDVATITEDGIELWIEKLKEKGNKDVEVLREDNKYELIREALLPTELNFIVTPKEIDSLIDSMTEVLATSINNAM